MDRRTFIGALASGLAVARSVAVAQPPGMVARIGYLEAGQVTGTPFFEAFRQGLRDLGWVEGQNLVIEVRAADGNYERLRDMAVALVRLQVDVIFASSTPAAVAAKHATSTIPIVIGRVADPVASGLVATLARPGGNITGWTHQGLEVRVKYLDLLKEAVPGASRIGVLWNPANPIHGASLKYIEDAGRALKVTLHPVGVSDQGEIEKAFATLASIRVQALAVFQDGMFLSRGPQIIALAARARIPTLYGATELVRLGGLMGYGVNLRDMYRHGATFVDRILRGDKPADLPVEQPTRFELVINVKTAKALGLPIAQSLMLRADEVIS